MKKITAMLLTLVLVLGLLPVTALEVSAASDGVDYRVGYAKVDLNPYWRILKEAGIDIPTKAIDSLGNPVTEDHIFPLPMGGYGGNVHRLSRPELVDDNGSGLHADDVVYLESNRYTQEFARQMLGEGTQAYKDYAEGGFGQNDGDGLYGTCVAIRENPSAEPILYFSVDYISMGETYCSYAKATIMDALKAEGIDIAPNRIIINATHTHGSFSWGESFTAETEYAQKLYKDAYTVDFLGSELTGYQKAYRQYVYGQLAEAAKAALTDGEDNGTVVMQKGTVDVSELTGYQLNGVRHRKAQLTTTVDGEEQTVDYVTGSSFNVDLPGETEISGVSDSDDRMHVLQFSFPDQGAEPVLMVNWRAHTTWNNKMGSKAYNNMSADFVAAMRWKLEAYGYRPILSYGTSGNLGTGGVPETYNIPSSNSDTSMPGNGYGYKLAFAAMLLSKGIGETQAENACQENLNSLQQRVDYYTGLANTAQENADAAGAAAQTAQENADAEQVKIDNCSFIDKLMGRDDEYAANKAAFEAERDEQLKVQAQQQSKADTYQAQAAAWQDKYNEIQAYYSALSNGTETLKLTVCDQGPISLQSTGHEVLPRTVSQEAYEAALYHEALATFLGSKASDTGGLHIPDDNEQGYSYPLLVPAGDHEIDGTTYTVSKAYVIASQYHARALKKYHTTLNPIRISLSAFTLGDDVAFVTVPFEASDRYSMDAKLESANDYNDWDVLVDTQKWGTPFVVSLTNGSNGYIPNNLAYTYTEALESKYIDGACAQPFVSGSYEAHTAFAKAGEGEKVVAALNNLLRGLENSTPQPTQLKYCHACKKTVEWMALNSALAVDMGSVLVNDHYYLAQDYTDNYSQLTVSANYTACLDLNGKTLYVQTPKGARAFSLSGTLNVQDSVGGGVLKADGITGSSGGTVLVHNGGTLNLYSGTLTNSGTYLNNGGGNVYVSAGGVFNMYGGVVTGGKAESYGGNVQVQGGTMHMYGGEIYAGEATSGANLLVSGNPMGTFRYAGGYIDAGTDNKDSHIMGYLELGGPVSGRESRISTLRVTGNVFRVSLVDTLEVDVTVSYNYGSKYFTENNGDYTSDLTVVGGKVGAVTNSATVSPEGSIKVGDYYAVPSGEILVLTEENMDFVAKQHNGTAYTYYNHLGNALKDAATTADKPLMLINDASSMTLSKDVYLDLNGYNVASVTTAGYELTVKDSATDDYVGVNYGSIPATVDYQAAGNYLPVVEENQVSFHRYALQINTVTLKTGKVGLSYDCFIAGDEKIKEQVAEFGIAMSVYQPATKQDIFLDSQSLTHVWRAGSLWQTGSAGQELTSVGVIYIMKTTGYTDGSGILSDAENQKRANIPVYGRAYMVLKNGEYIMGEPISRTLQAVTEEIDANYYAGLGENQKYLQNLYNAFQTVMEAWNLPNMKASLETQ